MKISGNADNEPGNRGLDFGVVPDSWETLSFGLPKIKAKVLWPYMGYMYIHILYVNRLIFLVFFLFHCVLLLNIIYLRFRCEYVSLNKTVSLQYTCAYISFLWWARKQYTDFHHFCVCVGLHTLALLLYLTINPGTHLCLCVPFHACDYVFMTQTKLICIQVLLPFKSLLCPSMACGLQVCAASWVTQRSPGFSCNLQLFIMHSTLLDCCRSRALHHCSLRREADAD